MYRDGKILSTFTSLSLLLHRCTLADGISRSAVSARASRSVAFLGTKQKVGARSRSEATQLDGPKEAGWFGDFSQEESTYTDEGKDAYLEQDPARITAYGVDPQFEAVAPGKTPGVVVPQAAAWFHESPSAGAAQAWQTHYPVVPVGVAGNQGVKNEEWRDTPEGWVQNYNPVQFYREGFPAADVFDSSVGNYDGFGRQMLPFLDSERRFLDSEGGAPWVERASNATIACSAVGCTANTSLNAFDAETEEGRHCRLSIAVHPTDYDNDFSHEFVEYFKVNGALVKVACDPMVKGCRNASAKLLYPCLADLSVDHLLTTEKGDVSGMMHVEGKVNHMVDECPYEGNLLSGVVTAKCFVRPKTNATDDGGEDGGDKFREAAGDNSSTGSAQLRCSTPGCSASGHLYVDPEYALMGGKCVMNVTVAQTDFDAGLGVPEQVEYVFLEGVGNVSSNVTPGLNPCTRELEGKPVSEDERWYSLLSNYNVTEQVLRPPLGRLNLAGKISEQVDECGSDGFLLNARVVVRCEAPSILKVTA